MSLGAMLVDGGFAENVLVGASSHFCAAEKQFRFPLALGTQRPPSATWTVTGDGSAVLSKKGKGPVITEITTGSQFISTASLYNATLKNAMLCACISFGGLSGIFQTKSVISDTSLNLLFYIGSKFFISLLSALLYLCFSTLIF